MSGGAGFLPSTALLLGKPTWNPKCTPLKRKIIFQTVNFLDSGGISPKTLGLNPHAECIRGKYPVICENDVRFEAKKAVPRR